MSTSQSNYIKALDGYRGIAIIAVLLVHWGYFGAGWIGVQMFFVLSGYLITINLLRDLNHSDSLYFYLKNFYLRRLLRIFPVYYVYVLLFIIINIVNANPVINSLLFPLFANCINIYAILPNHVDLSNVGHFWALSVEVQFYLLYPFVVYFIPQLYLRRLIISIITVIPFFRLLSFLYLDFFSELRLHNIGEILNFLPIYQIDAFAIGAAVALFSPSVVIKRSQLIFWIGVCIFVIAGMINLLLIFKNGTVPSRFGVISTLGYPYLMIENYQYAWGYSIINILSGLLVLCIVHEHNPISILDNKYLSHLGEISYGAYVFHVPILVLVKYFVPLTIFSLKSVIACVLYIAITFIVARFMREKLENYFLKRRKIISSSS